MSAVALPARITAAGSLTFRCPECGGQHTHGVAEAEIGSLEHRVSHCPRGHGAVLLVVVADERKGATA